MAELNYSSESNLKNSTIGFDQMINQFGVVTVMNAKLFDTPLPELCQVQDLSGVADLKAHQIIQKLLATTPKAIIDTLKIANINVEGPSKTVTGGQYANPLIKFGKTATIEMQDALGRAEVLEVLGGAVIETYKTIGAANDKKVIHITNDFAGPTTILGESFFIDQKTGTQVPVYILLYQVLPDSIFNLTQDSEGDATVFDLNGALLATTITIGVDNNDDNDVKKGVFYSILPQLDYNNKIFEVKYAKATGAEATVDDFIIESLNNDSDFNKTNAEGKINPVVAGYAFSDTEDGLTLHEAETVLDANTTLYVKTQA